MSLRQASLLLFWTVAMRTHSPHRPILARVNSPSCHELDTDVNRVTSWFRWGDSESFFQWIAPAPGTAIHPSPSHNQGGDNTIRPLRKIHLASIGYAFSQRRDGLAAMSQSSENFKPYPQFSASSDRFISTRFRGHSTLHNEIYDCFQISLHNKDYE